MESQELKIRENMKVEQSWEVGWYEEQDKPGVLALNKVEYGEVPLSQEPYFDWLQTQNPMGPPIFPVAREIETGKVVGFAPHIPVKVSWVGEECPALTGFNLVVALAYRRQGVYSMMANAGVMEGARRGYHFFYTFPNLKSLRGALKWDYFVVSQIPLVIRPLDMAALAETYASKPLLRWGLRLSWKVAENTLWRERRPSRDGLGLSIVEDKEFDDSYDRFWQQVKTKYELMLVRDRAFLQWRFHEIPCRNYQVLSARRGTEILGYVVLSHTNIRGTKVGLIADFLVLPGERGDQAGLHLLHKALQRFKQAQLALSGGLMLSHTQEYTIMRQIGYLPALRRFAPQPFHLIVRCLSSGIPASTLSQPETWYVSVADHDAV